jgi:hypothetical protein
MNTDVSILTGNSENMGEGIAINNGNHSDVYIIIKLLTRKI